MCTKSLLRLQIRTHCSKPLLYACLSYNTELPVMADRFQDQTVKVAEARDLQSELQRLKVENNELRKTVEEFASVEAARKKAEARVGTLEAEY